MKVLLVLSLIKATIKNTCEFHQNSWLPHFNNIQWKLEKLPSSRTGSYLNRAPSQMYACIGKNCPNLLSGDSTVSLWWLAWYSTPFLIWFFPHKCKYLVLWFMTLVFNEDRKKNHGLPFLSNEASLTLIFSHTLAPDTKPLSRVSSPKYGWINQFYNEISFMLVLLQGKESLSFIVEMFPLSH